MQIEQPSISIMLYLISCALQDKTPDESKLDGIDIHKLFYIAKIHSLSSIVYLALQKTNILEFTDPVIAKQWKELKEKTLVKNILMDAERKQLLAELEDKHIWYMPLKGCVLKYLYPHEEMRELTDNDILYDGKYQKYVKDVFLSRGYTVISYAEEYHDVYQKRPVYNYEMHTSLFTESEFPELYFAFKDIQEKLIPDSDSTYGRHLSNEDFYIYITAHSYRHYIFAGTGLRTLVDFYVMGKSFCETMDWEYVSAQLQKINLNDYEKICRSLAAHLFDTTELIEVSSLPLEEQKFLAFFCSSGTYGTIENQIINNLKKYGKDNTVIGKSTKLGYYFKRLFPGRDYYKERYPFLYKYYFFIPFFRLYRIIRRLIISKDKIYFEIKTILSYKEKK